jgi:hypothetical protein
MEARWGLTVDLAASLDDLPEGHLVMPRLLEPREDTRTEFHLLVEVLLAPAVVLDREFRGHDCLADAERIQRRNRVSSYLESPDKELYLSTAHASARAQGGNSVRGTRWGETSQKTRLTFMWSSTTPCPMAVIPAVNSMGAAPSWTPDARVTRPGGGRKASWDLIPLSSPEKYVDHEACTEVGSCSHVVSVVSLHSLRRR